ncbi:major capsid protein [Azotobacter bryophylli]|uniref:Major capsid protein n=1 Tax=Azotobacter bryophylli TaxID=1986537 RepID=A0ABV7AZV3_9GAMM
MNFRTSFRNTCIAAFTGATFAAPAFAADIDPTAAVTAIGSAQGAGVTVGQAVIAAVAALVAIGIIIAIVRKI